MFNLAKRNIKRVNNIKVRLTKKVKKNYDRCIKKIKPEEDKELKEKSVSDDIEKVINSPLRFYDKKTKNIKAEIYEENLEEDRIVLYLLFLDVNKFEGDEIKKRIESIAHENVEINDIFKEKETSKIYGDIWIGKEKIQLIGYDFPVEKEISEMTIKFAQGSQEEITNMENHNYYIAAYYEGNSKDYNLIYNAYAKLAYGFASDNFVGMANKYCCNVLTPSLIKELFENEKIFEYASTPAMTIWRNLIKIPYEDKLWFVTKGNNTYGIHEYAFKGDNSESENVYELFNYLFNYEYLNKTKIEPGCTIKIKGGTSLIFKDVYELVEQLESSGKGTLVVEMSN